MERHTDLSSRDTLTAIRYPDEILGPSVRPYSGAVGPGFHLVHNNGWSNVAIIWRQFQQFLEDEGNQTTDWPPHST